MALGIAHMSLPSIKLVLGNAITVVNHLPWMINFHLFLKPIWLKSLPLQMITMIHCLNHLPI
jgi:hypothetical protein